MHAIVIISLSQNVCLPPQLWAHPLLLAGLKKKGKKDFTELAIHISSAAYFCHDKGLCTP